MAYGSLDKKGRHRKERRNWKQEYEVSMLEQDEMQMIKARRGKSGTDTRDGAETRTGNTRRNKRSYPD